MTESEAVEPKESVAPVEGTTTCPKCRRHGFSHDRARGLRGGGSNICHNRSCGYEEFVTKDHVRREWTEAELRALMREVAIEVNRTHKNSRPVMGNKSSPYDVGTPRPGRGHESGA